ncbi:MAG TPA: hypothetical protein VFW71_11590, partial [Actinomycetota bacterium]|nr:hypothetical protein [Actinomycetota bacterium]
VAGTNPGDYTSAISCTGTTNPTSGTGTQLAVDVASNQNVTCTITNTRSGGTLTVTKHVVSAVTPDGGTFNLLIDGGAQATNVGDGGTTGPSAVTAGVHTVAESAGTGTSLSSYGSGITCVDNATGASVASGTNAGPLNVTVNSNQNVTCGITNTRLTGTLSVVKHLVPSSDTGKFTLQIDGSSNTTGTDVGDAGTTGPVTLPVGNHTVGEVAGTGTTLSNYLSSISCTSGDSTSGTGPLTVSVAQGASVTCTITNTVRPFASSQLTPTNVSCTQFLNGTAPTLDSLRYQLKNGAINNVSPGVFFYYSAFHSVAGTTFPVTITQSNNGPTLANGNPWPNFSALNGQIVLYDANCNVIKNPRVTVTNAGGVQTTTVQVPATAPGQLWIIGIKFDPSSIKNTKPPASNPSPTVVYSFSTIINTVTAASGSLTLSGK